MRAYVIADVEVLDPEAYVEYTENVPATIAAHGGRFLVRGGAVEALEGDWRPRRFVIVEFPSPEAARDWYESDEYAALAEIRKRHSDGRLVLVEGYEP
jgi:uncharacterized protein (DUF1330 family)